MTSLMELLVTESVSEERFERSIVSPSLSGALRPALVPDVAAAVVKVVA